MEIEKDDRVMVYDGGGRIPRCEYVGRVGDLSEGAQKVLEDAVYLFHLAEDEECDWLVILGRPWSEHSPHSIC